MKDLARLQQQAQQDLQKHIEARNEKERQAKEQTIELIRNAICENLGNRYLEFLEIGETTIYLPTATPAIHIKFFCGGSVPQWTVQCSICNRELTGWKYINYDNHIISLLGYITTPDYRCPYAHKEPETEPKTNP